MSHSAALFDNILNKTQFNKCSHMFFNYNITKIMSPLFWLEIIDWKKEINPVYVSIENIYSCFSSSDLKKRQLTRDSFESLKYFDNEAILDIDKVKRKCNQLEEKLRTRFVKYDQFKLFNNFKRSIFEYSNGALIASRSVLSRIMNTPFEINQDRRKWTIKAEIFRNKQIYLYYDKNEEQNMSEEMFKQYELLKRYLFVKHPVSYHRKVNSVFDEMFGAGINIRLGSHYMLYTTEISGIISERKINTINELNSATDDIIYCDIFEDGEFSEDIINYNPIWWSKAVLSKAKQCIIASYDKDNNCIKDIYKFNMDKFDDKTQYENLWSPNAAWNFLNTFLQFVNDSVNSIPNEYRNKCVWKFQSFPNNQPFVSCEIVYRDIENDIISTIVDETTFS
ncbi:hypothetical protein O3M35_008669 [Rhynocoris fuscipes]|uniref:RAI1-like domain-containing protein n=1 Tax=Rhynocoris fuscipes TaxID=488301 RepID=A0AAW1DCR2_9HEMI